MKPSMKKGELCEQLARDILLKDVGAVGRMRFSTHSTSLEALQIIRPFRKHAVLDYARKCDDPKQDVDQEYINWAHVKLDVELDTFSPETVQRALAIPPANRWSGFDVRKDAFEMIGLEDQPAIKL